MIQSHIENIHEKESFDFLFDNVPNFDAKKHLIEWLKDKILMDVFSTATLKDLRELVEEYANNLRFLKMDKAKKDIKKKALTWFNQNIKDFHDISDLKEVNQDMLLEKELGLKVKALKIYIK